ncbi:MAG: CoB--CoM heterodisulfide reductase iron-sulfur subunit A family protein [Candidatus Riflebacteria bacterium]|nr:CoB--CoM heterodisulfide reductase iron-sulfur subunit A family protein [Candidatus Riflebacteria bacterium]
MARIGVFICHCGENIARTVDCPRVAATAAGLPGVVTAQDYRYLCSDPGQALIREAIAKHRLSGVVVAACSPRMHERTFRRAVEAAGLNPYLCELANVREQCSWVHSNRELATEKAIDLVRAHVSRAHYDTALSPIRVPVTRRALVVGGGIAGIQAALDIADGGAEVVLVERSPSLGGHMAQLSETFPTLDCSQCILTPRMVEAANHPRIRLEAYTEVERVGGYLGNFEVELRRKARFVDPAKCNGCGACWQACPMKKVPSAFDEGLSKTTVIGVPFPQAVPNKPVIDKKTCIQFKTGKCGRCKKACPTGAIDFEQKDQLVTERVGAIVAATGFQVVGKDAFTLYADGDHPDVVTGLQFERLASASGPTGGEIRRPSDGEVPKTVVFLQCAGSREPALGRGYCSKICCMYTAKHAMLYRHKHPEGRAIVLCMDVRTGGKGYDEFWRRAVEQDGVLYVRSRSSRIHAAGKRLVVQAADTLLGGEKLELEADLVVLATAMVPQPDAREVAQRLGVAYDTDGWFSELHPKLRPVECAAAGLFLAGACQGPKDIPETVAQASATAAKVLGLFSAPELLREPLVSRVHRAPPPVYSNCIGCFTCEAACPYRAIEREELRDRKGALIKTVARVNPGLCQGCGTCVAVCRSKAIELEGFTDEQLVAALEAFAPATEAPVSHGPAGAR